MCIVEQKFPSFVEQSEGSQAFEEGRETWVENSARDPRTVSTPAEGQFPMHNATNVQFEAPKVPVIFVLGMYLEFAILKLCVNIYTSKTNRKIYE